MRKYFFNVLNDDVFVITSQPEEKKISGKVLQGHFRRWTFCEFFLKAIIILLLLFLKKQV
jgi:hypothetical protein